MRIEENIVIIFHPVSINISDGIFSKSEESLQVNVTDYIVNHYRSTRDEERCFDITILRSDSVEMSFSNLKRISLPIMNPTVGVLWRI